MEPEVERSAKARRRGAGARTGRGETSNKARWNAVSEIPSLYRFEGSPDDRWTFNIASFRAERREGSERTLKTAQGKRASRHQNRKAPKRS